MKTALITGLTGQDGSYLAELLLDKGYQVFGLVRRLSTPNYERIAHLLDCVKLISGDMADQSSLVAALQNGRPDEVYNLAAQSFVASSWSQPLVTGDITGLGVARLLEAIRLVNPAIRFYQASSSEMYGQAAESPQRETTAFHPRSPYAVAKAYGHYMTVNYRESYSIFAVSGICFNHESPRRGVEFVTRKVSRAVARIKLGLDRELFMGNLQPCRDWGYAKDYVEAMWLMMQQQQPDDYVIATGKTNSVKDLVETAFRHVGLDYHDYVKTDASLLRPAEVDYLVGDASKARKQLGWCAKTSFEDLVALMVDSDLKALRDSVI